MHWILYSEETDNDHYQQIADAIDKKIFEGMTFLNEQVYFRKDKKRILLILANRQQLMPSNRIGSDEEYPETQKNNVKNEANINNPVLRKKWNCKINHFR